MSSVPPVVKDIARAHSLSRNTFTIPATCGIFSIATLGVVMKNLLLVVTLCLGLGLSAAAQQGSADEPASRQDVENYLAAVHSSEMSKQMMEGMSKPLHEFIRQTFEKDKDKLPADFEARMNNMMDEYLRNVPFEEMQAAMVPIYEKHFSKGDINALTAFYSSPTGQKILKEMPAVMADAMSSMLPIMRRQIEGLQQKMQDQIAALIEQSNGQAKDSAPKKN